MTSGDMLLDLGVTLHADHDSQRQRLMAVLAGRLGYTLVVVPADCPAAAPEAVASLQAAVGDDVTVKVDDPDDAAVVRSADPRQVSAARARLADAGDARPVEVAVTLAIGRTLQEAQARAWRDARFADTDHPSLDGIYGTFEQAQEQELDHAAAGAGVLRVTPADDPDIADLLAQVRALVVGPTVALAQARRDAP
jgi:hypothetical protein